MRAVLAWAIVALPVACAPAPADPASGPAPPAQSRMRPPPAGIDEPTWSVLRALVLPAGAPDPDDPTNAFDTRPEAVDLGHRIFFDTGFAGPLLEPDHNGVAGFALGREGETGKVGCVSCHQPGRAFSDGRSPGGELSLGASWTSRRAPSLLDVARSPAFMWDGRHDALWNQVFTPFEDDKEINSGRLAIALRIAASDVYRPRYEALFGGLPAFLRGAPAIATPGCKALDAQRKGTGCRGKPGDAADFDALPAERREAVTRVLDNVGKAVAASVRQLRCGRTSFDDWVEFDPVALDAAEARGAVLFVNKAQCVRCHNGPTLSDHNFHNIGLAPSVLFAGFLESNDRGADVGLRLSRDSAVNTASPYSDDPTKARVPALPHPRLVGAFKTPSLRCAPLRRAFMHTGQLKNLTDVVRFFANGGDSRGFEGASEIQPLELYEAERADLVAFLESLVPLVGEGTPARLLAPPAP